MTVFAVDAAPPAVRGELTRWFLEIKPGVFVGTVNARIRRLLWERIIQSQECRGAVMLYSTNTEQGFAAETHGMPRRRIVDMEGILLVCCAPDNAVNTTPAGVVQESPSESFADQLANVELLHDDSAQ